MKRTKKKSKSGGDLEQWANVIEDNANRAGRNAIIEKERKTMYTLIIHNVGKEPAPMKVFSASGIRRDVMFTNVEDAMEAARLVDSLRQDTAYRCCTVERRG